MLYFWLILLIVINTIWLVMVPFALPGNWLIVITTALFAWWRAADNVFSIYTIGAITALAFVGEIIEFFGGMGGARKAGARFLGSLGAILGALTGALLGTFLIPIPFLGTLLGSCIGAGAGAAALELFGGRRIPDSVQLGLGAGIGQLIGTTAKITVGILIWLTVTIAAFWP